VKTVVHNIIFSTLWIDHFGESEILNLRRGEKAQLEYPQCGWFSKGKYSVKGWILDSSGRTNISLQGIWSESLEATTIIGPPLELPNPIWVNNNPQDVTNKWKLSRFAQELNKLDPDMTILPTDSRLRMDRFALENGEDKKASAEKRFLEEKQREEKDIRQRNQQEWKPKYFEKDDQLGWRFKGSESFPQ